MFLLKSYLFMPANSEKMKTNFTFLSLLLFVSFYGFSQTKRYVKPTATGTGDGSSWANASANLQGIINASGTNDQVWVAQGTYYPATNTTDRTASFTMKNGVAIYGGFSGNGTETLLSQRDFKNNTTILSGDIDKNDGANFANNAGNSYHVVSNNNVTTTAILDGFTITAGNANAGTSPNDRGGGMYNTSSSPSLSNLIFSGNNAAIGGGMFNTTSSAPSLVTIVFSGNNAPSGGGGMYNVNSSPSLSNAIFSGNTGSFGGGMLNAETSTPSLNNVSFSNNSAGDAGGGIFNLVSQPNIKNCIFWDNKKGGDVNMAGADIQNSFTSPTQRVPSVSTVSNTLLQLPNTETNYPTRISSIFVFPSVSNILFAQDPIFVDTANPAGADGIFRTADDGLALSPCSPALNVGDNTDVASTDILGNPRISNATVDLGAYEYQGSPATGTRLYVNASAPGNGDGTTWASAYQDLQAALATAKSCTNITEIWVAKGTYKPTTTTDRTISFKMLPNVKIYGSFAGNEVNLTDRTLSVMAANTAILSGDLAGDDVANFANNGENSYHVISNDNNNLTSTSVLNGFIITGGNANSLINDNKGGGGGMYNRASSPSLSNLTFSGNYAQFGGGGMWNNNSSPILSNISFLGNNAPQYGGGGILNANSSSPSLSNVTFSGNTTGNLGGGMLNNMRSTPSLNNVSFSNNSAGAGGGIFNIDSQPNIKNCIFWDNKRGGDVNMAGADIQNSVTQMFPSISTVSNTLLQLPNTETNYPTRISSIFVFPSVSNILFAQDPIFVDTANPAGADGIFRTADDGLALSPCSPALNVGDNTDVASTDILGNPRIFNTTVDMGAYEYQAMPLPARLYVNASATGANTGLSWADAFTDLQSALSYTPTTCLREIWVAKGTYYPTTSTTNRNASFVMKNNLAIYGGFVGTETLLSQRDFKINATILSGDIDRTTDPLVVSGGGSTLSITGNGGNSYHVIFNDNNGLNNSAVLDGFTITGGNATGSINENNLGGGMLNNQSSPSIKNVTFIGNNALFDGGGMLNSSATSRLTNVTFLRNNANNNGGGMANSLSSSALDNVTFSENNADDAGGGMFNQRSSPSLKNTTFSRNNANLGGGISNLSLCFPTIENSIFWGNTINGTTTTDGVDIEHRVRSLTTVSYTLLQLASSNYTSGFTLGSGNLFAQDPVFVNATDADGADNILMTADDGLALLSCSPALNVGNNTGVASTDITGNPRIFNTTVDMGAYELQTSPISPPAAPTVTPPSQLTVCSPNTLTLTASCASGTVLWSDNSTGTSLSLNAVGTYAISAKCQLSGCYSNASSTTNLEIKAKPTAPTVTPPSQLIVCSPNTLTLTASCASGTVLWSDNSTGTSLSLNAVGTYAISAKCQLNACESNASSPTNLEIKAKPTAPTVTPPSQLIVCSPNTLTLTASCASGTVLWSDNSTGTSLSLNAVGTYAISAKCVQNDCDSEQSSTTNLEIKSKPTAPTVTPPSQLTVCSPNTLTLTASCASGTVLWSDNSTGTSLSLNAVGTYAISAKCTQNDCDSDASSTTNLEIKAKPTAPTVTPPSQLIVCSSNTLTLTASCASGTVLWSDNSTGTSLSLNAVGTYAISAKCQLNGCSSDASSTTNLEIKAKPTAPTVTPPSQLIVCSPNTLTLTASCASGTVLWSDNSTGTSLSLNAVGTYAISAKCQLNACESDASSTTNLEIKAKPTAPTVTPPSQLIVCSPNTLTLTASCASGTVLWSDNSTGTSLSLNAVGTYAISAKCQLNACESDASSTTNLEIKAKPTAPTVTPPSQLIVCSPNTLTLTASCASGTVLWSDNSTGTSLSLNVVGTYAISAKCVQNGCDSDASSTTNLEIKAKPSAPTVTPPSQLIVCSPNTLTLTASCASGTVLWSDNSTGTSLSLNAVGTYAISAKCQLNGCDSDASSTTNLEIKAKPTVPTITLPTHLTVCSPSTLNLTATCSSGTVLWSNSSTGTSLTLSAIGTYSISAKCVFNGCESDASATNTLEIKPILTVQASNSGPYSVGQTVELSASTGDTYSWVGPNNFSSTIQNPSIAAAQTMNAGIYTLTITNGACTASATTNVFINGIDPCSVGVEYQIVKAGNPYQPLFVLKNGMNINQMTDELSILAVPICSSPAIASFEMRIQGPSLDYTSIQSVSPFALFDNSNAQVYGRVLLPGSYTLTVKGYSQVNLQGNVLYGPIQITFTILPNIASITQPSISRNTFCAGSSIDVTFASTGIFAGSNQYKVELSDKNGSFESIINIGNTSTIGGFIQPTVIGMSNSAGTISCTIPANIAGSPNYRIRVVSTDGVSFSPVSLPLTIHPRELTLVSPTDDYSLNVGTKQASQTIAATNKVNASANVIYQSGRSIMLNAGFEAKSGGVFQAKIGGCN